MKKIIEYEIEVPDFLDEEFTKLLSLLSADELTALKTYVKGMICGKAYASENIELARRMICPINMKEGDL